MRIAILTGALCAAAACGDDGGSMIDAPSGAPDASTTAPDADPTAPDAAPLPDAVPSTVTVTPGICSSVAAATLGTVAAQSRYSLNGVPCGQGGPACDITITAGQSVQFSPMGLHNFASVVGTDPMFVFRSGNTGVQACVTFTAATGGAVSFRCEPHATMTGTVTVN